MFVGLFVRLCRCVFVCRCCDYGVRVFVRGLICSFVPLFDVLFVGVMMCVCVCL